MQNDKWYLKINKSEEPFHLKSEVRHSVQSLVKLSSTHCLIGSKYILVVGTVFGCLGLLDNRNFASLKSQYLYYWKSKSLPFGF